jgi:hypothetical protein
MTHAGMILDTEALAETVRDAGFAFLPAAAMRGLLAAHGALADWDVFAASWDDLGLDTYMADGGRYRKRRHAVLSVGPAVGGVRRLEHQPHYQSRDYNSLNGGVARWFDPVLPAICDGPTMRAVLATCRDLFDRLSGPADWLVELHQFRIEARVGAAGRPTPEGMHRDGVDHVLVLLVGRTNIRQGVTTTHDLAGNELGSFTLTAPCDAALVDDHRVLHGVTPVEPVDPALPSHRDVLVVTFRRGPG